MNAPSKSISVRTTCPYCGVGCGIIATPDGQGDAVIAGDGAHPSNFGRLCSKGSALGETLALEQRLLTPMVRTLKGEFAPVGWDEALDLVTRELHRIIERDGPETTAFYLSGQLLTEDYYVANKLMKGFIGSPHVDTNSRLCMASSVAAHRRAFGADTVPGCYDDIDEANLIVLVGSNAAWCHPILHQRIQKSRTERGTKLVVIDPRRTATADDADLFLGLAPGSDTFLFAGLLANLADEGALDDAFIAAHTRDFDMALARARELAPSLAAVAAATRLDANAITHFYDLFRTTAKTVTAFSQGVNQSAQGTDKANAIINCHLATGRIGIAGASPFSLTGQPNAMGGREVGGLANQLAAHMDYTPEAIARVRRFWRAPRLVQKEGLKAVQMFEAIERGAIKALWVMGTNPAVSLPDANRVRAALGKLDLLIVSDNVVTNDTLNAGAHVVLPAQAWGEKSGTVTNSERRISRQRAFLEAPGDTKPDWWILCEVARRLGHGDAFRYVSEADIFREHAALSAFENAGARDFDLGGLADLSDEAYEALAPVQWPVPQNSSGEGTPRLFGDGLFFTPDRKACFISPEPPALKTNTRADRPLRLNTGRVRDQWHTMTRTGVSPRLASHRAEPYVEIHPDDAAAHLIADGGFARLETDYGHCVVRVQVSDTQQRGMLFAPIHWSDTTAADARVGALVAPFTDPYSGQPEAKATPVTIAPHTYAHGGFILARQPLALPAEDWWVRIAVPGGFGYRIAGNDCLERWREWAQTIHASGDIVEYTDKARGVFRIARIVNSALDFCLFVEPAATLPDWSAPKALFAAPSLTPEQRRMVLSGRSTEGLAHEGAVVCACFSVGAKRIERLLADHPAITVSGIGETLRAGTNCGSCLPELKRMIVAHAKVALHKENAA